MAEHGEQRSVRASYRDPALPRPRRWIRAALLIGAISLATPAAHGGGIGDDDEDRLWAEFRYPPADARPMVRWWWFGPAITAEGIDQDIEAIRKAGFGGVEVQPVYPMVPDGTLPKLNNLPYLSPDFLAALSHAGRSARAAGLRIDITGGSGWPFGGRHIGIDNAAAEIRMARIAVPPNATRLALPLPGPGESIVAVKIGASGAMTELARLSGIDPRGGTTITLPAAPQGRDALIFIAGRTGQQVKRAAVNAEGYVLDHISSAAVSEHMKQVAEPLLSAFAGQSPPDAFFSDSLEAYGSSWTGDLPEQFLRRRGYDLLDHIEALFGDAPGSADIRFDWARTLAELVDERYLDAIDGWATAHGTRFRAQVYGIPPVTLSSTARVALPEGEGEDWRSFTSTRWATSGGHLYGKPVISSEVWTWLHSPAWAATPIDLKMEADRHFLQGVNQLVGHGWPNSPPAAGEPGWSFYAAAALNQHNPWSISMPDVTGYLQRVSHLLRQGAPDNGVAIYLPIEDAFAEMRPARASANDAMPRHIPDRLVGAVLDAGHGFDFIDAAAIRAGRLRQKLLILPAMTRIDADAYAAIERWVANGGKLLAVGDLPRTAGGKRADKEREAVARIAGRLAKHGVATRAGLDGLTTRLTGMLPPDVRLATPDPALGFVRRKTAGGTLYFLVNSSNRALSTRARFRDDAGGAQWWDPMRMTRWAAGSGAIGIDLAPYESRILFLPRRAERLPAQSRFIDRIALNSGLTIAIDGRSATATRPGSWTTDPSLLHFSGTASYRLTLDIDPKPDRCYALDFGEAIPRSATPGERHAAQIDAPIRETARVSVNGGAIGSVWAPPYRIDITRALRSGANALQIEVGNTALNALAGRAAPDYRLLNLRFGERFTPQDTDRIAPQPSGLLKPLQLIEGTEGGGGCGRASVGRPEREVSAR